MHVDGSTRIGFQLSRLVLPFALYPIVDVEWVTARTHGRCHPGVGDLSVNLNEQNPKKTNNLGEDEHELSKPLRSVRLEGRLLQSDMQAAKRIILALLNVVISEEKKPVY